MDAMRRFGLPLVVASVMASAAGVEPIKAPGSSAIASLVANGRIEEARWPDFSDARSDLAAFYQMNLFAPAWVVKGAPNAQSMLLIDTLSAAAAKGLDPEDYDASKWPARVAALRALRVPSDEQVARFDIALSVAALRYVRAVRWGRLNPAIPDAQLAEMPEMLRRIAAARDPRVELAALDPQSDGYRRTEATLARYRALARESDDEMLPATKKPVEPESRYEGVARMARLLRRLGDLPVQAKIAAGDEYNGELVEAVKRFQARHGLTADGRIGKDTLAHLNTPLTQRVRQLELALERWRWMPRDFARPAIIVNIPEFKLRGISAGNSADLEMKVVVGGAVKHETPLITSAMKEVIFRPYWNVPRSILTKELLPKIRDDRSYLGRNEYEVVTNASQVVTRDELDDETLDQLRAGKLQIRQAPGKKNALGMVKFLFPNEYNVYMHDTPSTSGFARSRRDLSHGCVRLERPELLAAWVLRQKPEWTTEKISEAMQGTAPVSVTLEREIPVMIIYTTAAVGDNGEVRFFGDIYSQDAALLLSMEKGAPYSARKITTVARAQRPRG